MTLIMSFPVPPTQWVEMVGDDGDVDGQLMTVDDWYWRWWCTCRWRSSSAAVPGRLTRPCMINLCV